jgi:hypothetical protein
MACRPRRFADLLGALICDSFPFADFLFWERSEPKLAFLQHLARTLVCGVVSLDFDGVKILASWTTNFAYPYNFE